jgi:hypothetical protein
MFEAYSVGIRLRLLDSVSTGLIGLAGQFAAFNRTVGASQASVAGLESSIRRLKMQGMVGGALFGIGAAGLYSFKGPLEEAAAWQKEAAKFATLGFGDKISKDAQKFAMGMQTYGVSARENLSLVGDAMSVLKNLGNAQLAAPLLAKMKFGNEAIFGAQTGAANERTFMEMLKVIELRRGLSSPAEFATQADFVQKAISGSRGRVGASQWLQLLKTGGVGVSQLSNQAFYLGLEPLVQEFGGSRLGTSLMSIYQNLVQSRGTISAQQELYRLGLLDPHKVQFNQLGQVKKALPGAFLGSGIFEHEGPMALLDKVLLPAFKSHGITTEPQILDELGRILSNRTASSLLSRAYQQHDSMLMQWAANRNAMGIDDLANKAKEAPQGKLLQYHAQMNNLKMQLGIAVLPMAIQALEGLNKLLENAKQFAQDFPTVTKGLAIGFATLSALCVAGGAITLINAGFKGLWLVLGPGVGLGSKLLSAAGGLGALGTAADSLMIGLSKVGLLGVAAAAGYYGAKALGADALGGWLGGKLADLHDWVTLENERIAHPHRARGMAAVPGARSSTFNFTLPVILDGKKIAEVVTKHQSRDLGLPQRGLSNFDGSMSLAPAGGVGSSD